MRAFALAIPLMFVLPTPAEAQHTPTEEQLDQELAGGKREPRAYQRRSIRDRTDQVGRTVGWARETLARVHLSPARLLLILGIVGFWIAIRRNTRKYYWLTLLFVSAAAAITGGLAILFDWAPLK